MPIEYSESDEAIIVTISGSFDRTTSTELNDFIHEHGTKKKPIVINLWDVNYISSVSIGTLIKLHSDLTENDIDLVISNISDECQKIFDMVEIDKILPVYKTDDEALIKIKRP